MTNSLEGLNYRVNLVEEGICKLEDKFIEIK